MKLVNFKNGEKGKCVHCGVSIREDGLNLGMDGMMGDRRYLECLSCMDQMDSFTQELSNDPEKFGFLKEKPDYGNME